MSKRVFKYDLNGIGKQHILMPSGADILSCHAQGDEIKIWALVNENNATLYREFLVAESGRYIDEPSELLGVFIGTVLLHGGTYVLHVFDLGEQR